MKFVTPKTIPPMVCYSASCTRGRCKWPYNMICALVKALLQIARLLPSTLVEHFALIVDCNVELPRLVLLKKVYHTGLQRDWQSMLNT